MLHRLFGLTAALGTAQLRHVEAGIECCELALTGTDQAYDEATKRFFETQRQISIIGYQMYRHLTNAH